MKTLEQLRSQLARGEFEFSRHAFKRAVERNISDLEIREAGEAAEVIEDYPEDKYAPSGLLLGFTRTQRRCICKCPTSNLNSSKSSLSTSLMKANGIIIGSGGKHVAV